MAQADPLTAAHLLLLLRHLLCRHTNRLRLRLLRKVKDPELWCTLLLTTALAREEAAAATSTESGDTSSDTDTLNPAAFDTSNRR